jgi:hypothetical protein
MPSILQQIVKKLVEWVLSFVTRNVAARPSTKASSVQRLPLYELGFENCPAIPYWADKNGDPDLQHVLAMLNRLNIREDDARPAFDGLSKRYTIGNQTRKAYDFLYDEALSDLILDKPELFTLSWTTYQGMYKDSQELIAPFAKTLTDKQVATDSLWPTIASFGLPYNLLVLAKVADERAAELARELGDTWDAQGLEASQADGLVYEMDLRILASLGPSRAVDGTVRFVPGTLTVLKQDPDTKSLTPVAIQLSTSDGPPRVYTFDDNTWLYALQAVKASVTVWGIWLGHVYHWHIGTAAMQMTMFNNLPAGHRLYPLLEPQSQSVIDFDFVLLTLLWGQIAPPTPLTGYVPLVKLYDTFAKGRSFFDDDPLVELANRRLRAEDFTVVKPWDAYPVVGVLLDVWDATAGFVSAVVADVYSTDEEVATDAALTEWMAASRDPKQGNIRGLPDAIETRAELTSVLTSILYRVTAHGAGSLTPSVNPALAFVANFPPCLQGADIPEPGDVMTTEDLLWLLPRTGTIGEMTTFYFTFVYSKPYGRLIPSGGIRADAYFPRKACNDALFAYRSAVTAIIDEYVETWNGALDRLRGSSRPVPSYARDQYGQWPRSVEL